MSNQAETFDSSSLLALQIDELCDQFEAAVLAGAAPKIEDYLELMATGVERSTLLNELVLLEIEYRRGRRERFDIFEYSRRFPGEDLGPVLATIDTPPPSGARAKDSPPAALEIQVILSVVAGPNRGQQLSFDRQHTCIVGRGPLCHLRLPGTDKFVSRIHFHVEINPPFCRLKNMSSSNGTFVNGIQVTEVDLKDGDIILAGETAIRVFIEAPPA